jgi:hypothetical protein
MAPALATAADKANETSRIPLVGEHRPSESRTFESDYSEANKHHHPSLTHSLTHSPAG